MKWGTVRLLVLTTFLAFVYDVYCSPDADRSSSEEYGGDSHGWSKDKDDPIPSSTEQQRVELRRAKIAVEGSRFPYSFPSNNPSRPSRQSYFHPLDPLTEAEIELTSFIIRRYRREHLVFNYITLKEPEKSLLLPYFLQDKSPPEGSIPRRSFAILYDRKHQRTYEVTVNLDRKMVEKWEMVPDGSVPPITIEEQTVAETVVREDPEVQRRAKLLGYPDMSLVNADTWTMGYIGDRPEYQGRRLIQMYLYARNFPGDNEYAHPFDFIPIVDVNEGRVIDIEELPVHDDFDTSDKTGVDVPRATSNYNPELRDPRSFRKDLKPVNVSQPEGVSWTVKGNEISWQKFKFRVGINGREGLVIYNVNYKDGSKVRPLFYRMSVAEMFIPYGDPRPPYHRKAVFDEGSYGTGYYMLPLEPQRDCIGKLHFFDGILNFENGTANRFPRAVCMSEEDAGILWKHTDFRTGRNTVTRSQRLALNTIATLGNYDYLFSWYFYQDGTIEFHVRLSGILSTNLLAKGATPAGHGTQVFPQINALYHQHFFNLRIDPEIDGTENTVVVSDVVPVPGPTGSRTNPYGQGFTTKITELKTAREARTNESPHSQRTWHIRNLNKMNPYTKGPVAWKLMPWASPPLMMKRDSPVRKDVGYLDYTTWVTPYKEGQLFPAEYYLNDGLDAWVERNPSANVKNTDIVLWYNMGISHIPRTEDFPVMPVENCGVMLKPMNFFKENPGLDVPPPRGNRNRDEL